MHEELKKRLRRRIPGYLLAVVMVALVLHHWQKRPMEMTVTYHLGSKSKGLSALGLTYRRGTEVFAQARYSYAVSPAKPQVVHRVHLKRGDYDVDVELSYRPADKKAPTRTVRLRRPLLVREAGPVGIFIAEDT